MTRYIRTYPIPWPFFSIKNHNLDFDGWWNPKPKRKKIQFTFRSDQELDF